MNIKIFNYCIIAGWLLILVGGMVINVGWGLVGGGLSMIILTILGAKFGGLFESPVETEATDKARA